jgi:hypothetical protein
VFVSCAKTFSECIAGGRQREREREGEREREREREGEGERKGEEKENEREKDRERKRKREKERKKKKERRKRDMRGPRPFKVSVMSFSNSKFRLSNRGRRSHFFLIPQRVFFHVYETSREWGVRKKREGKKERGRREKLFY